MLAFYFLQTGCEEGLYESDALPHNPAKDTARLTEAPTEEVFDAEGSAVFWTTPTQKFETFYVTVLKLDSRYERRGTITSSWVINGGPECNECEGCAHFNLPLGMYTYYVADKNGKSIVNRGENFEVTPQGCEKFLVTKRTIETEPPDHDSDGKN